MGKAVDNAVSACLGIAALAIAASVVYRTFAPAPRRAIRADPPIFDTAGRAAVNYGTRIRGPDAAKVTIVEFTDLECPVCRAFNPDLSAVISAHSNQVRLIYVSYPLSSIHRFALGAARAAECATTTGQLANWIDAVFAKQDSLGLKSWGSFAQDAGIVDTERINICGRSAASIPRIDSSIAFSNRIKVLGTPTVFVNDWRFQGVPSQQTLDSVVTAALGAKSPVRQ